VCRHLYQFSATSNKKLIQRTEKRFSVSLPSFHAESNSVNKLYQWISSVLSPDHPTLDGSIFEWIYLNNMQGRSNVGKPLTPPLSICIVSLCGSIGKDLGKLSCVWSWVRVPTDFLIFHVTYDSYLVIIEVCLSGSEPTIISSSAVKCRKGLQVPVICEGGMGISSRLPNP